ncbi:MAG: hypothetical protein AAF984_10345 [Verrucomicrobiota bacterium]
MSVTDFIQENSSDSKLFLLFINDVCIAVLPIGTTEVEADARLLDLQTAIQIEADTLPSSNISTIQIAHLKEAPLLKAS